MIDSGLSELKNFAFGKILWQKTCYVMCYVLKYCNSNFDSVPRKNDGNLDNFSYKVYGFPIAFLIFIYETIPVCSEGLCRRVNNLYPTIVNWTSKTSVTYQHVSEKAFMEADVSFYIFVCFLSVFCYVVIFMSFLTFYLVLFFINYLLTHRFLFCAI